MGSESGHMWPGVVRSLLCMKLCKRLLVPRPSHHPVFDRLQMITNFFPHLATFFSSQNLLIDYKCGKKESKHFIALVEATGCPCVP